MKISLCYEKIPDSSAYPLKQCIMFEKYDGTNVHWVWKKQFIAFGVRRNRYSLDEDGVLEFTKEHRELEGIVQVFENSMRQIEPYLISNYSDNEVTLFMEYYGARSFAGEHVAEDPKFLVLFDCTIDGQMMPPERFLQEFSGRVTTARVVYRGSYNGSICDKVREGKYGVNEGVVIKGHKDRVYMAKIKTNEYLKRLKNRFGANWAEYWE